MTAAGLRVTFALISEVPGMFCAPLNKYRAG